MPESLTHHYSHLDQMRGRNPLRLADANWHLSERDQATLTRILAGKCAFVPNPLFDQPDAQRTIFTDVAPIKQSDGSWYLRVLENLAGAKGGNAMAGVRLTAAEEKTIFLQFNYCRCRVADLRQQISQDPGNPELAPPLLQWFTRAEAYRDQIVECNLALVLAMAKRVWTTVEFCDLVSEGNMALLRAVDKFDTMRGFKFSTYACRAILKAFSRSGMKMRKDRQFFPLDFNPKLDRTDFMEIKRANHEQDCADEVRDILQENTAALTEVERQVLKHRFAVSLSPVERPDHEPLTLHEVGQIIGVTKERVRQIQRSALLKIRTTLTNGFLGAGKTNGRFAKHPQNQGALNFSQPERQTN